MLAHAGSCELLGQPFFWVAFVPRSAIILVVGQRSLGVQIWGAARMARLKLDRDQVAALQQVCDLAPSRLNAITRRLREVAPVTLRPQQLYEHVLSACDSDESLANSLMRLGVSLNGWLRQAGIALPEGMEAIRNGLSSSAGWEEEMPTRWAAVEPAFTDFLAVPAFRILANAINLSYEYANLYRQARLLVDVRPLYSEDAHQVEGAVVTYTLRLRYENSLGDNELSIALDAADVRQLVGQCERAEVKAATIRRLMAERAGIPADIVGET